MKALKLNISNSSLNAEWLRAGRDVLLQAQQALSQVAERLDDNFGAAVEKILLIKQAGRLVVSGVGKAGFIAQKISATFSSIGVPSFFVHPTEAMHGDLGRVTGDDLLLVLSNSGETPELTDFLPHVRKLGCSIVSLTASTECTLAQLSDVVVAFGKLKEAGPLGLAPTTSTSVLLALGDALAMAVLRERPIARERFAGAHPGGALGRSLLLVSEVMRKGEAHCIVSQEASCAEVLNKITLTKGRPGAASIVNSSGVLVGIFTDGDLRRCLDKNKDFLRQPVSAVMGANPKTIQPDVLVEEALRVLRQFKIDQVVVVDEQGTPVGMVDIQDLLF
ncbi:MAG: KpsF/GutQ family sugar-phosphate isomerase [Oligoflexia bacterium]|nr:KpsF/GutQ family sugar-phosphate isomerase [Oligoflexia bacterium]